MADGCIYAQNGYCADVPGYVPCNGTTDKTRCPDYIKARVVAELTEAVRSIARNGIGV